MKVIEQINGNIFAEQVAGKTIEKILLKHDELEKCHRRFTTENGTEIAISLKEGSCLKDGDILYQDEGKVLCIALEEESVLLIKPRTCMEWAKAAYNIGNLHQKAYIKEEGIYAPYDSHLEKMTVKLEIPFEVGRYKLDGEKANVQSTGHAHG